MANKIQEVASLICIGENKKYKVSMRGIGVHIKGSGRIGTFFSITLGSNFGLKSMLSRMKP